MKDYYPYHPQSHPQMAPYIANDDMAGGLLTRRRPLPLPRSWRQRWRQRLSMLVGFVIVGLAVATLFLDAPNNYLSGDVEPRRVVSPEQWERLFATTPPAAKPPADETQTITEEVIEEDIISDMTPSGDKESAPPSPATPSRATPSRATPSRAMTGYVVQITAARRYDVARRHYDSMRARHADLISGLRFDIRRVDLGRRGVFHRLYLYPFEDQAGAQSLCRALKQRREECLVRKP